MPVVGEYGLSFSPSGLVNDGVNNWLNTGLQNIPLDEPYILPATLGELVPQQMISGYYCLSDDMAIRGGIGINSKTQKQENDQSTDTTTNTWNTRLNAGSYGIHLGMENHFKGGGMLLIDPYVGAYIQIGGSSKIKYEYNSDQQDLPNLNYQVNEMITYPRGCVFGLMLLGGVNYFFSQRFSIGAEIGWGYNKWKLKGDRDITHTDTIDGDATTTHSVTSSLYKEGGFGVRGGNINLSMFFPCSSGGGGTHR